MGREIIHISCGQCGNQIGYKFWEVMSQEHGIAEDGSYEGQDIGQIEKINVFFNEGRNRYVPRAILVDTEPTVLNYIKNKAYGNLYHSDNIISGSDGAANQFITGYYSKNSEKLADRAYEICRAEAEKSDCLQGITMSHSTAGGTGSGLGMKIQTDVSDVLLASFGCFYNYSVFPSKRISEVIVENYNTCMTLQEMSTAENIVVFDNESLHRICTDTLLLTNPTYNDLNQLIALVVSGMTACMRFPGQHNYDLNKLSYALKPRSFLHYYIPSYAPLSSLANIPLRKVTVSELVRQMMHKNSLMCECDPQVPDDDGRTIEEVEGRVFAHAALFRGDMCSYTVDEAMAFVKPVTDLDTTIRSTLLYNERKNAYLQELTKGVKFDDRNPLRDVTSICNYAAAGTPMSATYLRNSSSIKFKFLGILKQAVEMYNTRAFMQWFEMENVDRMTTLDDCLNNLTQEWIAEFGTEDLSNYPEALNLS